MKFTGTYKFNTKINKPIPIESVFLYKKLQTETRPFEYQSQSKSWQLIQAPRFFSDTGQQQLIALEIPDNTGDYETLLDAKARKRKAIKKDVPCVSPDPGDAEPGEDNREIVVLWAIREPDLVPAQFIIAGKLSGYEGVTSGNPFGGDYNGISPITNSAYVFVNRPYASEANFCEGYKGYLTVSNAIFCHNPPPEVKGFVSYNLNVVWDKAAYRNKRNSAGFDGIFYQGTASTGVPSDDFFETAPDNTYTANITAEWQPVAGDTADILGLNSCGSDSLDGWWLYDGDKGGAQAINLNQLSPDVYTSPSQLSHIFDYICWRGKISDYSAWVSYMNSMLAFWKILDNGATITLVGSMVINRIGGSCSTNPENGFPPDPNPIPEPLIGLGKYHGRYCDIFVNYQKNGIVKELKLPIDFPCRITHIVCEHPELYNQFLPMESPGQRVEAPNGSNYSEWFSGRVNIDKNNIYIDIIYEIIREYEPNLKVIPNKVLDAQSGAGNSYGIERPGIIARSIDLFLSSEQTTEEAATCVAMQPGEQIWARPTKDKFNKTIRYTINKKTFTIVNTETFIVNHLDNQELFTDKFLKNNTIIDVSQKHYYREYHDVNKAQKTYIAQEFNYQSPVILSPSPDRIGYLGLPTPYFQIDCDPVVPIVQGIYFATLVKNYTVKRLPNSIVDYTSNLVNDFLTSKTDWDDICWVFYLMMEQPYINKSQPNKLIDFKDRSQRKGAGYNKISNKFYLSYIEGNGFDKAFNNQFALVAPGFFDLYCEHERLRGYPIIKDGRIKQWLRLKPESFPLFEANRFY